MHERRHRGDGGTVPSNLLGVEHYAYGRCMERIDFKWFSFPQSSRRGAALDYMECELVLKIQI